MRPPNPFDAAHLEGAEQVERFLRALQRSADVAGQEARRHADNAFVLVEYLANAFPKVPNQAHERDAWTFLFDYYIAQGPFSGPAVDMAPLSVGLFFDFVARERRTPEVAYIREVCGMQDFYRRRVEAWASIARSADEGSLSADELDDRVADWQDELAERMRPRGLVPDAALAAGQDAWGQEMGPLEAAVFDAVCVVLARQARDLARRGVQGEQLEKSLIAVQDSFMRAPNPGLGMSPLEAVLKERSGARWAPGRA